MAQLKYGITNLVLGKQPFLRLTVTQFEEIKQSILNLREVLYIEEKYNLIVENYAEYEKELLALTTQAMVFSDLDWSGMQTLEHTINRRLVNLLTTCRLYMDHIPHNLNVIYGKGATLVAKLKSEKSKAYDTHLEYRIMEALRNYVQHRDLPITTLQLPSWWDGTPGTPGVFLKRGIKPFLQPKRLQEGGSFKAQVLKEIEGLGDKIDIRPMVRVYMDAICKIQKFIRDNTNADVASWQKQIADVEKRYHKRQKPAYGMAIVSRNERQVVEYHYITQNLTNRYNWLVRRNHTVNNFTASVITNEVSP